MTVWTLAVVVGACVGLALLSRRLVPADGPGGAPAGWVEEARRSVALLRPWLLVGPVCFAAAFALLQGAPAWLDAHRHDLAVILGGVPAVGVHLATCRAMWRVGDALWHDDAPIAQGIGASLVAVAGAFAGLVLGASLRFLLG